MKNTENERLKIVRNSLNLSQYKFSSMVGLLQGSYSDVERGKANLSKSVKLIIDNLFGKDVLWFIENGGERPNFDRIINCNDDFTDKKLTNTKNKNTEQNEQTEKFGIVEKSRRLDTPTKKPNDNMLAIVSDISDGLPGTYGNYIPIYDAPLAQLVNKNNPYRFSVAHINHPVFAGCDAVMRAKGNRMQPLIDDGFLMGVKEIEWQSYFPKGSIYAIITKNFEMLGHVHESDSLNHLRLKYANGSFLDEELPKTEILSMWHVKLAVPAGNPRTFN
jgi:transcriptional regulator with XRE-family HTH domain